MSGMIERVAKAICLAESRNPMERRTVGDGELEMVLWEWELRTPAARAAIQAMREPTENMSSAAFHALMDSDDDNDIYRAMIDSALEEK